MDTLGEGKFGKFKVPEEPPLKPKLLKEEMRKEERASPRDWFTFSWQEVREIIIVTMLVFITVFVAEYFFGLDLSICSIM